MSKKPGIYELGEFKVTSGELFVTDPCYEPGTWCQGKLTNVINGTWIASTVIEDCGSWGNRNVSIRAVHKDYVEHNHNLAEPLDADIGVDSGQASICDAAQYESAKLGSGDDEYGQEGGFYNDACKCTLGEDMNGTSDIGAGIVRDFGVVSSSGFGDGSYTCYFAKNDDGKVVFAEIIFIDEEEDIEDEDFEDEEE